MKIVVELTVIKNDDDTFSVRAKENWKNSTENLKHVSIDDIGEFVKQELQEADDDGRITKK